MKLHFKKIKTPGGNYFKAGAPYELTDSLTLTQLYEFPRYNKQFFSSDELSEIRYGDLQVKISLLNSELSAAGKTADEFFSYGEAPGGGSGVRFLIIADDGLSRWTGFDYPEITRTLTYSRNDNFIIMNFASILVEFKKIAETTYLPYPEGDENEHFHVWIANRSGLNEMRINLLNEFRPNPASGQNVILSKPILRATFTPGGSEPPHYVNPKVTLYDMMKGLSVKWGMVWDILAPDDYESREQPLFTLRIWNYTDALYSRTFEPEFIEFHRKQVPDPHEWMLMVQRRFTVNRLGYVYDCVKGILVSDNETIIFEENTGGTINNSPIPVFVVNVKFENSQYSKKGTEKKLFCVVNDLNWGNLTSFRTIEIDSIKIINGVISQLESHLPPKIPIGGSGLSGFEYGIQSISMERFWVQSYTIKYNPIIIYNDVVRNDATQPSVVKYAKQVLKSKEIVSGKLSLLKYTPNIFDSFQIYGKFYSLIRLETYFNIDEVNNNYNSEFDAILITNVT